MPERLKHLEFLQAIVLRMATNSFTIKGWSVILLSAILAFSAKDANPRFAIVAFFPLLAFWGLDAYYLRQERLFRALYSIQTGRAPMDSLALDTSGVQSSVSSLFRTLFAPTIIGFYAPAGAVTVGVLVYSLSNL